MGKSKSQKNAEAQSKEALAASKAADAERAKMRETIQTGTPEANALTERIGARRTAITAGNLDAAPDFIGSQANQAEMNRKSEAEWNAAPTGLMAIGSKFADPNQIALQTKVLKDRQARDASGNLENQWQGYIADTQSMESGVVGRQDNINMALMGDSNQRAQNQQTVAFNQQQLASQIAAARANMWAGLAGAGVGALGNIVSGGLTSGKI